MFCIVVLLVVVFVVVWMYLATLLTNVVFIPVSGFVHIPNAHCTIQNHWSMFDMLP
jgi:hypothetical protein